MLMKRAAKCLIKWEPPMRGSSLQDSMRASRRSSSYICYIPTNPADPDTKEEFYSQLESTIKRIPKRHGHHYGRLQCKSRHQDIQHREHHGKTRPWWEERERKSADRILQIKWLVIGRTLFSNPNTHKDTWKSPDQRTNASCASLEPWMTASAVFEFHWFPQGLWYSRLSFHVEHCAALWSFQESDQGYSTYITSSRADSLNLWNRKILVML